MHTHRHLGLQSHLRVHPIPAKLKPRDVVKYVVIAVATSTVLAGPNRAQQAPTASTASKPSAELLRAVEKGDVKKIRALASRGANLNFASPVVDVDDLQATAGGGYSYKFKTDAPMGGSELMLTAIRSARPESVQTLIDLGVDTRAEFFIDADLGVPVPAAIFANSLRYGLNVSVGGAAAVRIAGDHVISSIRPTPATKTTYLGVAEQLLSVLKDGKSQRNLQEIVKILRPADVREAPAGVSTAAKENAPVVGSRGEIHSAARDSNLAAAKDKNGVTPALGALVLTPTSRIESIKNGDYVFSAQSLIVTDSSFEGWIDPPSGNSTLVILYSMTKNGEPIQCPAFAFVDADGNDLVRLGAPILSYYSFAKKSMFIAGIFGKTEINKGIKLVIKTKNGPDYPAILLNPR